MQRTLICKHCKREKPANSRLKGNQEYCGDIKCQRARKAAWQREKAAADADYRADKKESNQQWRKSRPAHQYQKHYRERHPDYVKKNREQQKIRNKKQSTATSVEKIVKMDALTGIESNTYIMTAYKENASGKIVKLDTLFVQLELFQRDRLDFSAAFL